ncbi:hypothetical protein THIOKS11580010 [Thiocapsa sp. KS1]|nr:hypothetical protein [Thiocapsa sp. KS1]CRI63817.1 hypothetical protein THIOKS11580010 [Thiocapsa sp. KS1]
MKIQSTAGKTIIAKHRVGGDTEPFAYQATDRYGGLVSFVSEDDLAVGATVTLAKKPDGPMTVEELWKKTGHTIPIAAGSSVIALSPQAAQALGAGEITKMLVKQVGLPEQAANLPAVTDAASIGLKALDNPLFRHLAIFSAGFVAALGIQKVWWPDRPWHVALVTAIAAGAGVWGIYALIKLLV